MPEPASVNIDSLTKVYKHNSGSQKMLRALDMVSFQVSSGEIFALLGPNGAGKTTLIKILLGITIPTGGTTTIFGEPISDSAAHRWISYLPEQPRYPPAMTGEGFLKLSGRLTGLKEPQLSRRIEAVCEVLTIGSWRKDRIKKYSKGMLQRIGIAQTLINDPKLILLDEPSNGLDPIARKDLRDLLGKLRQEGKTIFINSHLLSEIEMIADRIAILNEGKLIKEGKLADIVKPTGGYRVTLRTIIPPHLTAKFSGDGIALIKGNTIIEVATRMQLDALLVVLSEENLLIESVVPLKPTLEDAYISLIQHTET
jgi:ABC-2 type transport system ATP-binding protein